MKTLSSVIGVASILGMLSACTTVPEPVRLRDLSSLDAELGATPQDQQPEPSTPPPQQSTQSTGLSPRAPSDARANQGWFIEPGLGLTAGPSTFLMAVTAGKFIEHNFALGPMVQLGVSGDDVFFAPTVNARGVFDLEGQGLERVKPYVEGGLGLAYVEKDHHSGDDDEWGFLVNMGTGVDIELERNITLGTGFIFNFMPSEVEGEHFIFSWKILQLCLYF
jgi:hypothetical protein